MKTNNSIQIDLQTGTIQLLGRRYSNLKRAMAEFENLKSDLKTCLIGNEYPKSYSLNESVLNIPAFDIRHIENRWVMKAEILNKDELDLIKQKFESK